MSERIEIECRLKRREGKLVAGKVSIIDGRVEHMELWGEFFADPELDTIVSTLRGKPANEALRKLIEALDRIYIVPKQDVTRCIQILLGSV